jgi:hypothetical protein
MMRQLANTLPKRFVSGAHMGTPLHLLWMFCLIVLVGCEAQATPIAAVDVPTLAPAEFIDVTQPPPLRYGIAEHTLPYVTDIEQIREIALVETLPPNPDLTPYDVAITYGIYDGWQQTPVSHHVVLIINTELAPMDNTDIQTLVRQAINSQAIADSTGIAGLLVTPSETVPAVQIRNTLANMGYPDGFRLTLAMQTVPASQTIIEQLTAANLEIATTEIQSVQEVVEILTNNRAHLLLLFWQHDSERSQWVERVGENAIIDLYTLPISYVAKEGITVSFSESGWVIGTR